MATFTRIILIASLSVLLAALCQARSDPMTTLCDSICWEEEALSDQCVEDKCSGKKVRSRAYRKCQDSCWDIVAPCRLMCQEHAFQVLDKCQTKCSAQASPEEDCEWDCYTHHMMIIKFRSLPTDYLNANKQ